MFVESWCCTCLCVVLCYSFCTGHFVMVPLNMTYLHCLQHSFFEYLFNSYDNIEGKLAKLILNEYDNNIVMQMKICYYF